jgi:predicted  nucleic acid-binding Zn-ribbon protein
MRGLDRLLELQELDLSIDRLEHRRERLGSGLDVAEARAAMEEAESRLGELRLALDAAAAEQRRLETELDSMERKAAAEERRLYDGSIANVKELEALQHEIASLKERKGRVEDDLLEVMERREGLEARIPPVEAEVAEARARVETLEREGAAELERVMAELAELRARREGLVREIDEELLELYEDLRGKKDGIGAAALVDGVCQACHEKLSALELDRVKHAEGIGRCEHCRRILVRT